MCVHNVRSSCVNSKMILLLLLFCGIFGEIAALTDNSIGKLIKEIEAAYLLHPEKGLQKSQELLDTGLEYQNEAAIAEAYFRLGQGNFYKGRIHLSNEYLKKALELNYAETNMSFRGRCLKWQGVNYDSLGDENLAQLSYQNALTAFRKSADSSGIADVWIAMAMLEMKLLRFSESEKYFQKALNYFESRADEQNIYEIYQRLSLLYSRQKQYDKALSYMLKVLNKYEKEDMKLGRVQVLYNIASLYDDQSKVKAIDYFNQALVVAKEIEASDMIVDISIRLSDLKSAGSEVKMKLLQEAKGIYTKEGNFQKLEEIYHTQLRQFAKTGDIKSYEAALVDFQEIQSKLAEKRHADKYEELKAVYEFEKKEDLIEIQKDKIKTKNILLICAVGLTLLLIMVSFIYSRMYFKVKSYAKSLYRINQELQSAGVLQMTINDLPLLLETTEPQTEETDDVSDDISDENNKVNKLKELYDAIIVLFEKDKMYVQNDLTVSDLSRRLNTNDKYISQAINSYSSGNFSSLVNAYRINEARRLIKEHGKELAIKELADRSGFNSLNTFYKKFKEATGLTPLMYIEIATEK